MKPIGKDRNDTDPSSTPPTGPSTSPEPSTSSAATTSSPTRVLSPSASRRPISSHLNLIHDLLPPQQPPPPPPATQNHEDPSPPSSSSSQSTLGHGAPPSTITTSTKTTTSPLRPTPTTPLSTIPGSVTPPTLSSSPIATASADDSSTPPAFVRSLTNTAGRVAEPPHPHPKQQSSMSGLSSSGSGYGGGGGGGGSDSGGFGGSGSGNGSGNYFTEPESTLSTESTDLVNDPTAAPHPPFPPPTTTTTTAAAAAAAAAAANEGGALLFSEKSDRSSHRGSSRMGVGSNGGGGGGPKSNQARGGEGVTPQQQQQQPSSFSSAGKGKGTSKGGGVGGGGGGGSGGAGGGGGGGGTLASILSQQQQPPSLVRGVSQQRPVKGSGRSMSRARQHQQQRSTAPGHTDDEDDEDENGLSQPLLPIRLPGDVYGGRDRALSPAPGVSSGIDQDDEVERRDRGEELVRKRMKDRARLKKEAERATKKREHDARTARTQLENARRASFATPPTSSTYTIGGGGGGVSDSGEYFSERAVSVSGGPLQQQQQQQHHPSLLRAQSELGPGPSSSRTAPLLRSRDSSAVRSSDSYPYNSDSRAPSGYATSSVGGDDDDNDGTDTPVPGSPALDAIGSSEGWPSISRGFSNMLHHGAAGGVAGQSYDSTPSKTGDDRREDVSSHSILEEDEGDINGGGDGQLPDQRAEDNDRDEVDEEEDDDDEDDENEDGEVEYTLKDRQDAINIEHPFGLPIWKPALYKKSRSVTRNAETALHATPSSAALRHLAPGNILWTLFFGIWLSLVCIIVSAILWCVPWGGEKYATVIWELAGYLFWPFGKYVEGWTVDDMAVDEEDDESNDGDDDDNNNNNPNRENRHLTTGAGAFDEESGTLLPQGQILANEEGGGQMTLVRGRNQSRPEIVSKGDSQSSPNDRTPTLNPQNGSPTAGEDEHATLVHPSPIIKTDPSERTGLLPTRNHVEYGSNGGVEDKANRSSSDDDTATHSRPRDFTRNQDGTHKIRVRALGRTMYWLVFYLIVAPLMLLVCIICWGMVFTIPMAKLLWVLLRHLSNEPLSLHFRSPPKYSSVSPSVSADSSATAVAGIQYPLRAGQRAPPVSRKSVARSKAHGRIVGPRSTVLLCTYRAAGSQYYKYTIDGVNIMFINLLSMVFFVIADFWFIAPKVEEHGIGGLLGVIGGQAFMFITALLSVIPLSYFIGMAVASISAQSSIGMGAVINASFGSIIEIILYCIALTQAKGELVEGSIVGSFLAGVLLMPGLSMIGGAMRRKEQRFNARSAGVTSTMLIMAIIGILTPTIFYEIYGSFQLSCTGCDPDRSGTTEACKTCYYEHVDPVEDPFYQQSVRLLSYWCAGILVLSYLIGLWFSLRTHASQIWQNAQSSHEHGLHRPVTMHIPNAGERGASLYKRVLPGQFLSNAKERSGEDAVTPSVTPAIHPRSSSAKGDRTIPAMALPEGMTSEDVSRALQIMAATASAIQPPNTPHHPSGYTRDLPLQKAEEAEISGGHDAPNWSRLKSASVLMSCTVLYAIIAEILVNAVDVVLEGSGIPEKLLGVTLFALVPNTTEFMNAISFAINGNIALSMEIGSAYALQVCLIQAPAMLAFSTFYGLGKEDLMHRSFTLVFPRWDMISIILSVFLLTYTYIEARANYYRGSILCLSYLVFLGGFALAPHGEDTSDNPILLSLMDTTFSSATLSFSGYIQSLLWSLFSR